MSAPDRIHCRIDTDLTDTGEFLGTCWRDDDGLSIPYLRADAVTARLAAAEAMAEAATKLATWDHCWPGNINLEHEIGKLCAALEKWRAGK